MVGSDLHREQRSRKCVSVEALSEPPRNPILYCLPALCILPFQALPPFSPSLANNRCPGSWWAFSDIHPNISFPPYSS